MYVEVDRTTFKRLILISNIKKEYLGKVAAELLEEAAFSVDIKALKNEYNYSLPGGDVE